MAAGTETLPQLTGNSDQTVRLHLVGRVGHPLVQVEAPPTIFH